MRYTIAIAISILANSTPVHATPAKLKQMRFFQFASANMLPEFKVHLPLARPKTIDQALIYAATGDAVDVITHLVDEHDQHVFNRFQLRRALELAAEFGAANTFHYLLSVKDWSNDELERVKQWSELAQSPLINFILNQYLEETAPDKASPSGSPSRQLDNDHGTDHVTRIPQPSSPLPF